MFRKLKSIVVVFLKIIVSFVLTRPFGKVNNAFKNESTSFLNSCQKTPTKILFLSAIQALSLVM